MSRFALIMAAALVATVSACDNEPAEGKTKAVVAEAASANTAAPPSTSAMFRYEFSNDGSELTWVGAKVTRKHDGAFGSFRGKIEVVDLDPTRGSVTAEIDTASITSDEEKLTGHLKSPDFFDVEKMPKATFASTAVQPGGEGDATHTITGNLTLHGVTKSITFPAKVKTTSDSAEVDAEFAINRKDFGIVYPGMPDDLIKDDVLIRLKIRAKKQA